MVDVQGFGDSGRVLYGPEPPSILMFSRGLGVKTSPLPPPPLLDEGFPVMLLVLLLLLLLLLFDPVVGLGVRVAVVESSCWGGSILDKLVWV